MKMLWNLGVNYAATTPLWYTLTEDQKYCHTGHRKEIHWLHLLEWKTLGIDKKSPNHAMKYDGRYRSFLKADKAHEKPNKPSHLQYPGFYHKFQLGTVQDYISYYQRVWEHVKHEYASVGDFSNTNAMMRESYIREIRDQILDAFDLKIQFGRFVENNTQKISEWCLSRNAVDILRDNADGACRPEVR